jgi:carbon-monoxide dehydrogenase small subunit
MPKEKIQIEVNGRRVDLEIEPDELLVDVLRDRLGLKGTKAGCRAGECGACSVIIDGDVVPSCLIPAVKVDGSKILTVEGLDKDGELHPLQTAFLERGAVQCGFCTPGMLISAKNLLDRNPKPGVEEIKVAISGVLCRCTGYQKIIEAIHAASEKIGNKGV